MAETAGWGGRVLATTREDVRHGHLAKNKKIDVRNQQDYPSISIGAALALNPQLVPLMSYIDAFVIPLPKKKIALYRTMARFGCKLWTEHGALDYKECIGHDLK